MGRLCRLHPFQVPRLILFTLLISTLWIFVQSHPTDAEIDRGISRRGRSLLEDTNSSLIKCIPSGIDSFPLDFFTQEQRQKGGVIVHVLITLYICAMIGVVCKDYFIPSLEIISDNLQLPSDIAGATFMAIGTSAPELFSSIAGSFITEGDIGIGTIVGSAVFNIVGVSGIVGIAIWNEVLDIDWFPIARDCTVYGVTICSLIWIISDNVVQWWESLILLLIFIVYITIMSYNQQIETACRNVCNENFSCFKCWKDETTPLIAGKIIIPEIDGIIREDSIRERDSFSAEFTASRQNSVLRKNPMDIRIETILQEENELYNARSLCSFSRKGKIEFIYWLIMFPARLLFVITIPDSSQPRLYKLFPLTFIMAIFWIGILSYLAVWMVTIIGYTFLIPDSISGLTILAIGTSVPEVITSLIVAKNGYGNMSISNLVGSNTFDISFCLGLPWLIKTLTNQSKNLLVYSSALTYTTATLLFTLIAFVLVFVASGWRFNRTVGLIYIGIYCMFLALSCMYELNVFGKINVPTCSRY